MLRVNSDRIEPPTLYAAATLGTLLVSANMLLSDDPSALSGELLYAWLALYAAYFFPIRQAVFQLGLMSAAYLGVLLDTLPAQDVVGQLDHAGGRDRPRGASCCAWCAAA